MITTALAPAARPKASCDWQAIFDPDTRIVLDPDGAQIDPAELAPLLASAPFAHRASGAPDQLVAQLPALPQALQEAVGKLARRFADLMEQDTVRLRLEGIVGNACRKVHADFTDLRLICTLAGPGTDYSRGDDADGPLERIPTGTVALFKGLAFGPGHAACLHRSPPIEGTGARRLVVVIDTAQKPADF